MGGMDSVDWPCRPVPQTWYSPEVIWPIGVSSRKMFSRLNPRSRRERAWCVLLLALLLDVICGDLPNRYHPVAYMGRGIGGVRRHAPTTGRALPLISGAVIAWGGGLVVWGFLTLVVRVLWRVPGGWLLATVLLKQMFAVRGLYDAAGQVEDALRADDLSEARRLLSWHLVSRDTTHLSSSQVAAAAIESVAENASDGIIAPLTFYLLGGLPAAYAYRWVQTCDSMLGYRDAEREWLGKVPARTDDLLNLVPARLTAVLFVVVSGHSRAAWHVWRRDAGRTASPNAGHPMSAAAGALDVELEKVDHYTLNAGTREPSTDDLCRVRWMLLGATALFGVLVWPLMRKSHD